MSRRTAEANKAIRLAWERERELVLQGKGTRDWSQEQQRDIIDPEKGKAYDDKGRAFEGQHMRSVAEYPEYQGNPDNIQFLTKEEHLEAHKGSWKNPTNWYYNPVTKEFIDFGTREIILCKVIPLTEPIFTFSEITTEEDAIEKSSEPTGCETQELAPSPPMSSQNNSPIVVIQHKPANDTITIFPGVTVIGPPKLIDLLNRAKKAVRYVLDHPLEAIEKAVVAGVAVGEAVSLAGKIKNAISSNGEGDGEVTTSQVKNAKQVDSIIENINQLLPENNDEITYSQYDQSDGSDNAEMTQDIIENEFRSSPRENDVSAHKQRYHTKSGVEWRDKEPYHRGGNN